MFGMLTLKLLAFDRSARRCGPLARGLSEVARTKRVRAAAFGFQIAAKGRNVAPPAKPRGSGRARLCRLFGFTRARRLSLTCRRDAERPSRGDRRDLGIGPEENPAARRELGFVPDHADRDAIDVGNVGTAKAKRIVAAGLLLLGSVGRARRRQHRNRERRCEHQTELEIPGPDGKHESPQALLFANCG
jgi:hypothetical protein